MKKKAIWLLLLLTMVFSFSACKQETEEPKTEPEVLEPADQTEEEPGVPGTSDAVEKQLAMPEVGEEIAVITTSMGEISVKFFPEEAPKAVENFLTHAKEGYYDGVIFHRVINDFMIQSGDPTGTGSGGESIWGGQFEDEYSPRLHQFRGTLSMANAGTNTNSSQFFIVQSNTTPTEYLDAVKNAIVSNMEITLPDQTPMAIGEVFTQEALDEYEQNGGTIHLDYIYGYTHTVFGQVFEGMDVVDAIAAVEINNQTEHRPLEDILIEKIEVMEYKG